MFRSMRTLMLVLVTLATWGSNSRADQVAAMIEALGDFDLRQGASVALADLGAAAVPALRASLAEAKPETRVWSAYTLGQIGPAAKPAVGELTKALGDADAALRAVAAAALGKIRSAAAVEALSKALDDEDGQVRGRAVAALGNIGAEALPATAQLVALLRDHQLRTQARDALIRIGPAAADVLAAAVEDDHVRFDVAYVLQEVDPKRREQLGLAAPSKADLASLQMVLSDELRPQAERTAAAASLAALSEAGIRVLMEAFEQPHAARIAAAAFSQTDAAAVPFLAAALKHAQPNVRATSADALGHMGPVAAAAVADLVRLLEDEDRQVRNRAVRALHEMGAKAKPAIPALSKVIMNAGELEPTRQWALKTLLVTLPDTHDAVVEALIAGSQEKNNYGVRSLAIQLLRKIDPKAAAAAGIR